MIDRDNKARERRRNQKKIMKGGGGAREKDIMRKREK